MSIICLQTYVPTVFENYTACLELEDQRVELSLWDTSGEDITEAFSYYNRFMMRPPDHS